MALSCFPLGNFEKGTRMHTSSGRYLPLKTQLLSRDAARTTAPKKAPRQVASCRFCSSTEAVWVVIMERQHSFYQHMPYIVWLIVYWFRGGGVDSMWMLVDGLVV